jgi:nucleoside-diphosphate-sugar epimerase
LALAACESLEWEVVALDRRDGLDVCSPELPRFLGKVDVVLHCAAPGNIHEIEKNRVLATTDHCTGNVSIVEAASQIGARVVAASTWEVYSGGPAPISETTGEVRPDHFYGALKLAAEQTLLGAASELDVSATALRIGTVWASEGRREGVIPLFVDRARNGLPITIEGNAGRQFTRAEDVAQAFVLAAQNESSPIVNIVAPEMIQIASLAQYVADRFDSPIHQGAAREHDASTLEIDSGRARTELGWEVRRSFWEWLDDEVKAGEIV